MSQDNADELRKQLQKLSQVKDKVDLGLATRGLCELLEAGTSPLPKDAGTLLKEIYQRLPTTDEGPFLRYGKAIIVRVYPHIKEPRLRDAIKRVVEEITRRRVQKHQLHAVRSAHLGVMKEALSPTPPPAENCLNYFLSIWSDFQDNDDTEDFDVIFPTAIAVCRELNGDMHSETADCYEFHAHALRNQGHLSEAFDEFGKAKKVIDELVKTDDSKRLTQINLMLSMCDTARQGGFPERATDLLEELKKLAAKEKFVEAPQYGEFYDLMAKRAIDDNNESEAIEWYQKCLKALRGAEGAEAKRVALQRQRVALALARIYAGLDEPELVEKFYAEALSVVDHINPSNADEVADNLYHIAFFYSERRNFARSEELLDKALHLKQQAARHRYVEQELIERELSTVRKLAQEDTVRDTKSLESLLGEIEEMIGLEELKKSMRDHGVYLEYLRMRRERGMEGSEEPVLHAVFTGNPGTGKTTVAKLLGQVYHRLGLLSSGHVHTVVRADLVGHLYGAGEKGARKALAAAKGGVLFIDEAYSLARPNFDGEIDQRDPGMEVIETLLPVMTDPKSDIAVVVAGYPQEMKRFLDSNPGLKSRFKLFFNFPDYTPPEMLEIAMVAAKRQDIELSEPAQKALLEVLEGSYKSRDKSFGNARYVTSLIDECKRALAMRIMRSSKLNLLSNQEISVVSADDVHKACNTKRGATYCSPLNERLLQQSLDKLNSLTGLSSVKAFVNDFVKVVRVYRELGKDVQNSLKFNLVFSGNPGTGKTTVARLIADIYKALGIIERGHLVETDRSGLIGKYVGESESNTRKKIEEAMGGVLFIDEAYALLPGGIDNDFGTRAMEVILKEMEDKRGKFFVIFAGYKKEMQMFMDGNPGLRSRIDKVIDFEDYTPAEMEGIVESMLKDQDLVLAEDGRNSMCKKLEMIASSKGFANARSARALVERLALKHFALLADIPAGERTPEILTTVSAKTVEQVELADLAPKRPVGF